VLTSTLFSVDQIKKYKMGEECSTCEEEGKGTEGFGGEKYRRAPTERVE